MLNDRINFWLPRILGASNDGTGTVAAGAAPLEAAGLPLADFGISETLIDTRADATG